VHMTQQFMSEEAGVCFCVHLSLSLFENIGGVESESLVLVICACFMGVCTCGMRHLFENIGGV